MGPTNRLSNIDLVCVSAAVIGAVMFLVAATGGSHEFFINGGFVIMIACLILSVVLSFWSSKRITIPTRLVFSLFCVYGIAKLVYDEHRSEEFRKQVKQQYREAMKSVCDEHGPAIKQEINKKLIEQEMEPLE